MTLDVGGGLESADDQRNQKTSTDEETVEVTADGDKTTTIQPDSARQSHYVLQDEIEESGAGSADYNLVKYDKDFGTSDVDHIVKWGYNIAPDNSREDTGEPQMVHTIESKFNNGSQIKTEQHMEGQYPDGTSFRTLSTTVRYDPSKREVVLAKADLIQFTDADRNGGTRMLDVQSENSQLRSFVDLLLDSDIRANNGNFLNIYTTGTGSDGVAIRDAARGSAVFQANENGAVQIGRGAAPMAVPDIATPSAGSFARIYTDNADGDLKVLFPNGTEKTIASN